MNRLPVNCSHHEPKLAAISNAADLTGSQSSG